MEPATLGRLGEKYWDRDSTDDDDERSNDLPRVFRHDHAYVGEVAEDDQDDRQHHEGGEDDRHVHLQGAALRGSGGVQRELTLTP